MAVTNFPLISGVGNGGGSSGTSVHANFASFPATGTAGIIYVDTGLNDLYLWTGTVYELQGNAPVTTLSFWSQIPSFAASLNYIIEEYDQFGPQVSVIVGNLYAPSSGTSAAVQVRDASESQAGINTTEYAIGVTSLNPGTSSTGRAALGYGGAQGAASYKVGIVEMIFGIRQNLWALGSAGEDYTVWTGFMDIITAQPTNGVYFRYNHAVNSGKWEFCVTSGGSTTAADTGVSPTALAYQVFEVKVNAAGTSATFYIDKVLVGTVTTGFPTAGLLAMSSVLRSVGTGVGGAGLVGVDAICMATERKTTR